MASVIRYEPFARSQFSVGTAVDRLFDRIFDDAFGAARAPRISAPQSGLAANLYETESTYWVELPLPGVRPEDVEVTVQENVLSLRAKRSWETPQNAKLLWQGFGQGEWQRSFTLPGDINADKVSATLEHGLLRLELAKADHLRPRTIKVSGAAGAIEAPAQDAIAGEGEAPASA